MIHNNVIQADLLAAMKVYSSLLAVVPAVNMKEQDYAGRAGNYPATRINVGQQRHISERGHCDHARLDFSVSILSESDSSKQADDIAGIVNDLFHGDGEPKRFNGTGWYTYLRCVGLVSAFRTGEKTWSALAQFAGTVYPTS